MLQDVADLVMTDAHDIPCEQAIDKTFSRHLIYDQILHNCSAQSIFSLRRVGRQIYCAVQDYNGRVFNVNRRLFRFFVDPLAFRSLQARTATVISGSFALQFFDRSYFSGSDLDLYVHPNSHVLDVGHYLHSEGYQFQPCTWQLEDYRKEIRRLCERMASFQSDENEEEAELLYQMRSVRAVYTFCKAGSPEGLTRTVQIIVSRECPMASILDFHSTCVMNVITFNAAYAFYPIATYEQRMSLVINDSDPNAPSALEKYARRGWRAIANPSPLVPLLDFRVFHFGVARWLCDSLTWTVHLPMDGVSPPPPSSPSSVPLTWDPIAECGWILRRHGDYVRPWVKKIATTVMFWRYTVGDREYLGKLTDYFKRQGATEHSKVPSGKSMPDYAEAWTWCVNPGSCHYDRILTDQRRWDSVLPLFRTNYLEEKAKKL
ncbi:hypothetical protein OH77DRAFT_1464890 [Trametes cingulata]|nr:hypothetical protein OH77DRAFT_1464890 [Trametes cingulata]